MKFNSLYYDFKMIISIILIWFENLDDCFVNQTQNFFYLGKILIWLEQIFSAKRMYAIAIVQFFHSFE